VISLISRESPTISSLVKGHSTVLVRNGHVNAQALKAAHMTRDDLDEDLRQEGVDQVSDVKEAQLERSGELSVIRK